MVEKRCAVKGSTAMFASEGVIPVAPRGTRGPKKAAEKAPTLGSSTATSSRKAEPGRPRRNVAWSCARNAAEMPKKALLMPAAKPERSLGNTRMATLTTADPKQLQPSSPTK